MYHLKYINKGHNAATISINNVSKESSNNEEESVQQRDEVMEYQHKCYISGSKTT